MIYCCIHSHTHPPYLVSFFTLSLSVFLCLDGKMLQTDTVDGHRDGERS